METRKQNSTDYIEHREPYILAFGVCEQLTQTYDLLLLPGLLRDCHAIHSYLETDENSKF